MKYFDTNHLFCSFLCVLVKVKKNPLYTNQECFEKPEYVTFKVMYKESIHSIFIIGYQSSFAYVEFQKYPTSELEKCIRLL